MIDSPMIDAPMIDSPMIDSPMIDAAFAGAWAIPAELHLGLDPAGVCRVPDRVWGSGRHERLRTVC